MRCPACDVGLVVPVAMDGRSWRYRNIPDLPLPPDLAIPTCNHCGEWLIDFELAGRLDRALEPEFVRQLQQKTSEALELISESGIRQRELEPLLGLSAGYLSKIKRGKDSSPQLVATLMLLATEPGLVEKLKRLWSVDVDLRAERDET